MESQFICRNGASNKIDIPGSIHAFTMALGQRIKEEESVRKDKVLRKLVREVFKEFNYPILHVPVLVTLVGRKHPDMNPKTFGKLNEKILLHIRLNAGGYLQLKYGRGGGVTLTRRGRH